MCCAPYLPWWDEKKLNVSRVCDSQSVNLSLCNFAKIITADFRGAMFFNLGFGIKPDGVCCFLGAVINRINAIFFSAVLLASSNAFGTTYTASPSLGSYSAGGNVIRFKFTNPANSSAPS